MSAIQKIIVGVVAVLIGVVLIGPVAESVSGNIERQDCTGSLKQIGTSSIRSTTATHRVTVPVVVNIPGVSPLDGTYPLGTLCTNTNAAAYTHPSATVTSNSIAGSYFIASAPPGPLAYAFGSARSLVVLIPLIFVAAIVVLPIYLVWSKVRG